MCGISLVINGTQPEVLNMFGATQHRGNKHSFKNVGNIKSAFTQLSITDQDAKVQPYQIGKYTIWFNGFISNYKELAEKYAISLKTNCDTELLSYFIAKFDYTKLDELNGFFAIASYDGEDLKCFTDRYGIKQLYKYQRGETTYICSEVKGILAVCPDIELDETAVEDWKYSLGVMTPNTIYKGIDRVECLPFIKPEKSYLPYENAKTHLVKLLNQSFYRNKTELKSGVFLSGGVDSGILAKAMNPDYCFSMDYHDNGLSEIENIKINSTSTHYTMICNDELKQKYVPLSLMALDDLKVGSCYTNFALTELASKFCTVLYSGAGADELFNGYSHRYSKTILDVISRTSIKHFNLGAYNTWNLTHKDYDWLYLKGILVVEDRMSGFHTMETRYPFLDNDLVDFVLSLPDEYLIDKKILKDVSGLDSRVLNSKKKGFSNPISNDEWVDIALKSKIDERHLRQQQ